MNERMCPECGSETDEWALNKECSMCGHSYLKKLSLKTEGDKIIKIGRLLTSVNSAWIKPHVDKSERRYWSDDCQMIFAPQEGKWILKGNDSVTNATLVDGKKLTGDVILVNGMQIAVGKAALGETPAIIKTPMQVILE